MKSWNWNWSTGAMRIHSFIYYAFYAFVEVGGWKLKAELEEVCMRTVCMMSTVMTVTE